jgi:hypothetical protein
MREEFITISLDKLLKASAALIATLILCAFSERVGVSANASDLCVGGDRNNDVNYTGLPWIISLHEIILLFHILCSNVCTSQPNVRCYVSEVLSVLLNIRSINPINK